MPPAAARRVILATLLAAAAAPLPALAQAPDTLPVRVVPIAGGVSMLVGRGGNLAVSAGPDGVFLVDDQYAPMTERIRAAVATLSDRPVRFVVNTHWHGDHTGGNENFGRAGAVIVAHDNVRRRMSTEQFIEQLRDTVPASPREALPVVTFAEGVTFHLNGDEVHVFHVPPAHTDGDALVHFRRAGVIHMGDTYFNGFYPFIDLSSGGSVDGVIGAANRGLALADAATRIIPGHGPLSGRDELRAYRDMLVGARAAVLREVAAGKTLEQVKAARPTAQWDARWGNGFMRPEMFVEVLYKDLSRRGRR